MKKIRNWMKANEERSDLLAVIASLCATVAILAIGRELTIWVLVISAAMSIGANLTA